MQSKSVFDLKLLFVNHSMQSYNLDLLILVETNPYSDTNPLDGEPYQVFSTSLPEKFSGKADALDCVHLQLSDALARRKGHVMSFVKLERSVALIVFDDGMVWHLNNDRNEPLLETHFLPIPFDLIT